MYKYLDLQLNIYITKMYGTMSIKLHSDFFMYRQIHINLLKPTCQFTYHQI
jgi:hypothetical protein